MKSALLPPKNSKRHGAFTLIELLTVIAIIGILAAIIIPTVSAVRTSARRAQGVANLRQVTLGALMVANENKGNWWYSTDKITKTSTTGYYYARAISNYLRGQGLDSNMAVSDVFNDPIISGGATGHNHFAPNAAFFLSFTENMSYGRASYNKLANVRNPSRMMFFADCYANLTSPGPGYGEIQNVGQGGSIWSWGWSSPSVSMAAWTHDKIANYGTSPGQIDFNRDKNGAKIGFLDGHVMRLKTNEITHAMVDPACN